MNLFSHFLLPVCLDSLSLFFYSFLSDYEPIIFYPTPEPSHPASQQYAPYKVVRCDKVIKWLRYISKSLISLSLYHPTTLSHFVHFLFLPFRLWTDYILSNAWAKSSSKSAICSVPIDRQKKSDKVVRCDKVIKWLRYISKSLISLSLYHPTTLNMLRTDRQAHGSRLNSLFFQLLFIQLRMCSSGRIFITLPPYHILFITRK